MPKSIPEGHYQDQNGEFQKDRRTISKERRTPRNESIDEDRRNRRRRITDLEFRKHEADQQIKEALETFAEEHNL